jgi:hypothetical protein
VSIVSSTRDSVLYLLKEISIPFVIKVDLVRYRGRSEGAEIYTNSKSCEQDRRSAGLARKMTIGRILTV